MKLTLTVLTAGRKKGTVIPVRLAEFLIGRAPGCNLRPKTRLVSDRHCVLRRRGERVFLEDLGSANGTFVNNKPVKEEIELHDQDRLRVGFLTLRVDFHQHEESGQTPAELPVSNPAAPADARPPAGGDSAFEIPPEFPLPEPAPSDDEPNPFVFE